MKKIIFLDRDGTINIEKNYMYKVEDFEFEYGVIESLKKIQSLGYKIIIITNQSGIARGYYSESDLKKLHNHMINNLKEKSIYVEGVYYCPHHKDGVGKYKKNCKCRKPGIGLIEQVGKKIKIDYQNSFIVGDKISDIEVAIQLGMNPILVRTGHGDAEKNKLYFKAEVYKNLLEFANYLNGNS